MKINIKPVAYLLAGVGGPDFLSKNRDIAQSYCTSPGYANAVEPLHPESLVIELAGMLKRITEVYAEVRREISEDHPDDGWTAESMTIDESRALLKKITDGSST